jgi:hypothetical protein
MIRKKARRRQRAPVPRPKTVEQFRALPERSQDALTRAANVLTGMRGGESLAGAARKVGIDPRTVRRLVGKALRKTSAGRYAPTKSDRLVRVLAIPTPKGVAEIATRGSRDATTVAGYWNAVQLFLETGDSSALDRYQGRVVRNAQGEEIALLTDLDELEHLGSAGVLSFESLYARVG